MREHYNLGVADCGRAGSTEYANGCRCDACRRDHNARQKRTRLRIERGEADSYVDPRPTIERIRHLRGLGYTDRELMRYGVNHIDKIMRGECMVRRSTECKVMAIGQDRRLSRGQRVDQSAARYLVKRWCGYGLSHSEIARLSGVGRQTISNIYSGKNKHVAASTLGKLLGAKPAIDEAAINKAKEGLTHELRINGD